MPLLHFDQPPTAGHARRNSSSRTQKTRVPKSIRRAWHLATTYGPAIVAVALILSATPSIILVTIAHHYKIKNSIFGLVLHIFLTCLLTFLSFSSFIVCITRDPGPVGPLRSREEDTENSALDARPGSHRGNDELSLVDALAGPSIGDHESSGDDSDIEYDDQGEKRWCRKCWAPKPERTHHCSYCKRCVLKMDHHCPWLANKCVGHRTYPSFIHFLVCTTLVAAHAVYVSVSPLKWYFSNVVQVVDLTPLHVLYLALGGAVFTICMGSFAGFHAYLVTTGQTTIEQLSPYMLLRYLPPPGTSGVRNSIDSGRSFESGVDLRSMLNSGPEQDSSPETDSPTMGLPRVLNPPIHPLPGHEVPVASRANASQLAEHTMTRNQRRILRSAASKIYVYDLGWRRNWLNLLAIRPERYFLDWLEFIWWGGHGTRGDGRTFARNPNSGRMLQRLRERLDEAS